MIFSLNKLALRLINFLCPGIVQLYQGHYCLFLGVAFLPFFLILIVSWSKLIFSGLALFYIPLVLIIAQLIAAITVQSTPMFNRRPSFLIRFSICLSWVLLYVAALWWMAANKSWLLGFDVYRVNSNSMEPTLFHGEYVLADTRMKTIKHNDIVFFQYQPIGYQVNVKRVLALPDDKVIVTSGKAPAYIQSPSANEGVEIKKGEVFLTGDNPKGSFDSREFGAVPERVIRAKAIKVYRRQLWVDLN